MKYVLHSRAESLIWRSTMAFTGVGSTMLGPFLPRLIAVWHIQDRVAGMLVAALFLGSFSGTVALSDHLHRCLRRGSIVATLGCLGFACAAHLTRGFAPAILSLALFGFGMGQLMSSLNLLVGAAPVATRARQLAGLSAAWCVGAVMSPCLSTLLLPSPSPSIRLGVFAILFLLPLVALPARQLVSDKVPVSVGGNSLGGVPSGAVLCAVLFLVYGGVEASISAWMPAFTARYSGGPLIAAQWIVSLFWGGLIVGRALLASFVSARAESLLLRIAILASIVCLTGLLLAPSVAQAAVGSVIMGVCIAPLFPLLLSTTLVRGYSNRTMGRMLAGCALGSALFPFMLGVISNTFSLRAGMVLPIAGLVFLVACSWKSRQNAAPLSQSHLAP